MSIQASEIIWRKPAEVSDAGTNGGRMTATAITTGVKNNIWPDVSQAERSAGSTKYRKVFLHVANDADLALIAPKVFVETYTPGDDRVIFFAGTQTDTQTNITGSERKYGGGKLNTNANQGAGSIAVLFENAADAVVQNGDTIRISDKTNVNDATGNAEYHVINGAPSWDGNVATITLTGTLAYGYLASNTRVASVYKPADIEGAESSWVKTSTGGTYDHTTYPVLVDHIGGVQQNWTITFSSATNFSCVGDTKGSVGSGNISSDFQPSNGDFSKPYFNLRSAGFGGTWQSGDTITFTTAPASLPIWYRRTVPAGASSLSGNKFILGIEGESE